MRHNARDPMASASVSFRITRSTEDLAGTIHALSQRLVRIEQRLAALERQLDSQAHPDPAELESLENVERLLRDCRDLLECDPVALDDGVPTSTAGRDRGGEEQSGSLAA